MIRFFLFLALLSWFGGARAASADPLDFIVQQVCTDAAGRAVAGDPVHCPNPRRLRIGEAIPYRRVDAGNWQAFFSYPVRGLNGETRAVTAKVFGGADTSGSFNDLGVRSGYDLLEAGPHYVSGIRTSDQGAGDQIFWRTTDCKRADGWIFFPPGLEPGQHGEARSTLKITPGPSTECPSMWRIGPDFTVWERPTEPYRYTSGKLLDTIQSMHFAYGDPADPSHDNDSMEKFYFTKPYGFSRWEAWETPAGCQRRAQKDGKDAAEACRPSSTRICNGPNTATFFGKLYLRLDCRDDTFYVADAERPFNPLVSSAAPGDVLSRNLLANGSFADGLAGWQAAGDGLAVDAMREPRSNNAVLHLSGTAGTAGLSQAFVVPAAMLAPGRVLRWGLSLASPGRPLKARVVLTLEPEGAPPLVIDHAVEAGGRPAAFSAPLPDGGGHALKGRLDIRVEGPADATLDDVFTAVLDAEARP